MEPHHHLPPVEEEKEKEEEAGHYDFDDSSPESSPDHIPDSIEPLEQHNNHNISQPPSVQYSSSTSPPPVPEGHYELESSPEPDSTDSIQQHPEEVAHNNNHNIAHPPPPSVTVQYSSPSPPLPPQQQESRPQFRKVLEDPSPDSRASTPEAAAAAGPKVVGEGGGDRTRKLRPNLSIVRKTKLEKIRRRSLIGCRSCGLMFCLVSLSVLAADKDQGWALDSFYRYKEFRYCLTVNVIGFMYSSLQAADVAYRMIKRQMNPARSRLRDCFDFCLDQASHEFSVNVMAYLLLSASTTAAYRVEEWESNWGKDQFPTMARASLSISFLAFVAFALTSLLSGYTLFTSNSF
ncbi:CASP-like protein 4A3 [Linum perenne]